DTSQVNELARPPLWWIEFTVAAAVSGAMAGTTGWAPCVENSDAMALPIPEPAPVMTATLFVSSNIGTLHSAAISSANEDFVLLRFAVEFHTFLFGGSKRRVVGKAG